MFLLYTYVHTEEFNVLLNENINPERASGILTYLYKLEIN